VGQPGRVVAVAVGMAVESGRLAIIEADAVAVVILVAVCTGVAQLSRIARVANTHGRAGSIRAVPVGAAGDTRGRAGRQAAAVGVAVLVAGGALGALRRIDIFSVASAGRRPSAVVAMGVRVACRLRRGAVRLASTVAVVILVARCTTFAVGTGVLLIATAHGNAARVVAASMLVAGVRLAVGVFDAVTAFGVVAHGAARAVVSGPAQRTHAQRRARGIYATTVVAAIKTRCSAIRLAIAVSVVVLVTRLAAAHGRAVAVVTHGMSAADDPGGHAISLTAPVVVVVLVARGAGIAGIA